MLTELAILDGSCHSSVPSVNAVRELNMCWTLNHGDGVVDDPIGKAVVREMRGVVCERVFAHIPAELDSHKILHIWKVEGDQ